MNTRLNSKNFIAVTLLLSCFYIGELKNIIFPNSAVLYVALLGALLLFMKKIDFRYITKYELIWLLAFLLLIVGRNRRLEIGELDTNILYYGYMIVLIIVLRKNISWISSFVHFLYLISFVHATATIIFRFVPAVFQIYAANIVSPINYAEVVKRYAAGQITGLCVNYGLNAGILALGTGVAAIYAIFGEQHRKKYVLATGYLLFALLLTGKRSPAIFTTASVIAVYLLCAHEKLSQKMIKLLIGLLLGLMMIPIVLMLVPQLTVVFDRLADMQDWSTLGGRTELYEEAIKMFKQHPVIGNGWTSYLLETEHTIGRVYEKQYARMMAHNIYLQLLAETGVVGLITFLYLFLSNTIKLSKMIFAQGIDSICEHENSKYIAALIYLLLFFMLYGFSGNPLYDAYMYIMAMLCCAGIQAVIIYSKKGYL